MNDNELRLVPVGRPYRTLLLDLLKDQQLAPFGLGLASQLPPKAKDALNIEGLCGMPDGRLLIGFRNPIPNGRALLVPMVNPNQVWGANPRSLAPRFCSTWAGWEFVT